MSQMRKGRRALKNEVDKCQANILDLGGGDANRKNNALTLGYTFSLDTYIHIRIHTHTHTHQQTDKQKSKERVSCSTYRRISVSGSGRTGEL